MSKDNNFTKAVKELLGEKENDETEQVSVRPLKDGFAAKSDAPSYTPSYVKSGTTANEYVPPAPVEPEYTPIAHRQAAEATYINCDTVINGSITSKTDIKNEGQVTGDIITTKNICVTGKVDGNLEGESVQIIGGYVIGNVIAKKDISNDFASIIIGDVSCQNFSSDGKVKGNLKIEDSVSLKSNAVVCGNVSSKKISIQDGAVLKGNVQIITSQQVDDAVFDAPKNRFAGGDGTDELFEIPKHLPKSQPVAPPVSTQAAASKYAAAKSATTVDTAADAGVEIPLKKEAASISTAKETAGNSSEPVQGEFTAASFNSAPSTSELLGSLKQRMLEKDDNPKK